MLERGFSMGGDGGMPPEFKPTFEAHEDGEVFVMGEFGLASHELQAHRDMYTALDQERGRVEAEIRALEEKKERLYERMHAIQEIPKLFDIADFETISSRLDGLEAAGVNEIKIGEKVFTVAETREQVRFVRAIAEKIAKRESELKTPEQIETSEKVRIQFHLSDKRQTKLITH